MVMRLVNCELTAVANFHAQDPWILHIGMDLACRYVVCTVHYSTKKWILQSLLGQVGNSGNIPGVLKQSGTTAVSKDKVSWSNVVCRNL